ncbi:MAG: PAS domain S-box/diguanylate cyclase (GGDEF) domain-containing protein [Nitrospirae bacterium]|nr:MAG: PAS domain S-box/diguanylate cyclase (GGDEF) domain-containing protein [Nitrospirota bacterium]
MKPITRTLHQELFDTKTVSDILDPLFVHVEPESNVVTALALMRQHKLRCIAVTYKKKPVGIFSERNLLLAAHYRRDLEVLPVEAVMSSPVIAVPDSTLLFEAFALMLNERVSFLAVVDHNGDCIGVASRAGMVNIFGVSFFYQNKTVSDVMLRTVATAHRGEKISAACARMAETGEPCILLEHERKPLGIMTAHDMSALILSGADLSAFRIEDVAAKPIISISPSASLDEAIALMNTHEITILVVIDQSGQIAGLITEDVVLAGIEAPYFRAFRSMLQQRQDRIADRNRELTERSLFLEQILTVASDTAIIATDLYLKIKYFNDAASMLLGSKPSDVIGLSLPDLFSKVQFEQVHFSRGIDAVQRKHKYTYATEFLRESAHLLLDCWVTGIRAEDDILSGYVWMARDVTEHRELQENLRRPLLRCRLTGLLNRQSLLDTLMREIDRTSRYGSPFSVIMLDVDRLKTLNDTFGYHAGDAVLRQIASMMSSNMRRVDIAGRWGGGEFVVIAPETSESEATSLADRIRELIEGHYFDEVGEVTISGGVAQYRGEEDADSIIRKAEKGLSRAKSRGRNRIEAA